MPLPARGLPLSLVRRLSMKWREAVDRAVAPLGLTHAQYSLVAVAGRVLTLVTERANAEPATVTK